MTNKPRHRRNPDPRRRGLGATGTGLGMAVGGAMAAVSMSSPSADDLLAPVIHDGAFTELAQTTDPSAVTVDAVPAQAALDAFEQLALQIDPNAFTAAGDPNDFIGTIVSQIDTDLVTTVFGPEWFTIAEQIISGLTTAADPAAFVP